MKILIISNRLLIVTKISNYINLNFINKVRIFIANDISSSRKIINNANIDLILLDLNISDLKSYKEYLSFIPTILIGNLNNNKEFSVHFENILLDNLEKLSLFIHKYTSSYNHINLTKKTIIDQLMKLGFNIKHKGTEYIVEAILILKFYYKSSTLKEIYTIIAHKHHTTSDNIKSNILKSINYMYWETDFNKIKNFFNLDEDIKPTPKQVIFTVYNNI